MKFSKSLLVVAVGAALAGCGSDSDNSPVTCETADSCTKFTVLHTNDNHGRFWENSKGEYGMAARKTLIDSIRAEVESSGGETILLSGGDINTGVPESDMQDAEPDFIGMNLLGYDAMAVGNHEFDNALDVLNKQIQWADFPMLAANIYKKDTDGKVTDERYFAPYKVFTINGLKVAVVGLTTKDTAKLVNPSNVADIYFEDPQVEIKKVLKEIEANETVDLVFATTHMGHYQDGNHGSEAPGDVLLARSLEEGQLDAIIGGHSQNPVCMEPGTNEYADFKPGDECAPDQQNGTYIMQAHEWGKYVGRADFEYYDGKLHLANYALIPVNLKAKDANGDYQFIAEEIKPDVDCDAGSVTITDINGKGFNLDATYTFAVISFSAAGGDDYPVIQVESTQMTDASVLREFFVNNPQISADSYNKNLDNIKYFSNSQAVKGCPATGS
ncbi:bifunctional UDP-sugar hydrolase/5'-nucleotidase UshA [Vibrio parahaemolyticus]|uniref:bifunctional UDP-sugar hydrolase/5'-nucleotidase UshA n=1 Tax=Vibrio parahaemolyticus TaxID=670 RepID=UPI001A8CD019|nr:bifunctional UDP-sugar hydrolase/5'-nucleotidase UshA [Vibrio parahaemolyticus]EJB8541175.1 bifunctional UDP-sugar hydrolase/5'-nucleotidase [Vibrio parahaemolyticus]MBO0186451.1 bifunctional UDP-sugar hydrolase/5'-nucleotidase [Vibrio parahaemolyticus]MBO0217873.1 bifunctional UDP-sugar hydrolase/5'-nucleotidase [Vibrio parahaemolyticus]MDF4787484.1 bifunctional UDP-sugar hydrolase/5'-nucleotidase UshA [Vibrio parahaemolyticus]HBC3556422.1 bifunctional UDP-sugar hydrolase/5'-nucleotidase [